MVNAQTDVSGSSTTKSQPKPVYKASICSWAVVFWMVLLLVSSLTIDQYLALYVWLATGIVFLYTTGLCVIIIRHIDFRSQYPVTSSPATEPPASTTTTES